MNTQPKNNQEKEKSTKRIAYWIGIPLLLTVIIGCSSILIGGSPSTSSSQTSSSLSSSLTSSSETVSSSGSTSSSVSSSQPTFDFRLQQLEPSGDLTILYSIKVNTTEYFITQDDTSLYMVSAFNGDVLNFKENLPEGVMLNPLLFAAPVNNGFIFNMAMFQDGTFSQNIYHITSSGIENTFENQYLLKNLSTIHEGIYIVKLVNSVQQLMTLNPASLSTTYILDLPSTHPYSTINNSISSFFPNNLYPTSSMYFIDRFNIQESKPYIDVFTLTHTLIGSFVLDNQSELFIQENALFHIEPMKVTVYFSNGTNTVYNNAGIHLFPRSQAVAIRQFTINNYNIFVDGQIIDELTGNSIELIGDDGDETSYFAIVADSETSIYSVDRFDLSFYSSINNMMSYRFISDWKYPAQMSEYDSELELTILYTVIEGGLYTLNLQTENNVIDYDAFTLITGEPHAIYLNHDNAAKTLSIEVSKDDAPVSIIPIDNIDISSVSIVGAQEEFLVLSIVEDGETTSKGLFINLSTEIITKSTINISGLVPALNSNQNLRMIINRTNNTLSVFNDFGYAFFNALTGSITFSAGGSNSFTYELRIIDQPGANDWLVVLTESIPSPGFYDVALSYGDISLGLLGMSFAGQFSIYPTVLDTAYLYVKANEEDLRNTLVYYSNPIQPKVLFSLATEFESRAYEQDGVIVAVNDVTLEETETFATIEEFTKLF